jgi:phytoene synthase
VVEADAYAACLRIARRHYENFPVASRLVPASARPHIAAVYAFARLADDMADEGRDPATARLEALDHWRERLHEASRGRVPADGSEAALVFTALAETMRVCALPVGLFDDLLSAFSQDVTVHRYREWSDVLDYCRRSANPIGRLVLRIFGYRDEVLDICSDAICTALQLTNFWQDLARDWRIGRLYLPTAWCDAAGAREDALDGGGLSSEWRDVLGRAADRTRALFIAGRPLADRVRGRLRWELRATWLGGMRILARLEAANFDVFQARPELRWPDAVAIGRDLLLWRTSLLASAAA